MEKKTFEAYEVSAKELESVCASDLLEQILSEYDRVALPKLTKPVVLNRPIVLKSGKHLTVHPETVVRLQEGCGGCMVRNEHPFDGRFVPFPEKCQDHDISVEGGIWELGDMGVSPYDNNAAMQALGESNFSLVDGNGNKTDAAGHAGGHGMLLGVFFFSNVERFSARNAVIRKCNFYGILIAGGHHFQIENITFDDNYKDGVHINGPSSYGTVRNVSGTTGDDLLALNAWDWCRSAASFGAIHHIEAENLSCDGREFRLLPGRKTYEDGTQVECPIYDCTFNNMSGLYLYKMYQQPNCTNDLTGEQDKSDIPGVIERISFDNIQVAQLGGIGLGEVSVDAIFEICADCRDIHFRNICLDMTKEEFVRSGMKLVKVGPKSSTWKRGYTDPAYWCELFDTELVCTAEDICFQNICFSDGTCTEESILIGTTKLTPNPDYPNTTPKGGNGYGIVNKITII